MRRLAAAVLFLFTLSFAESQQEVYYRALKAEEAGNVQESLVLFEEAAEMEGPYTEEIREILAEYEQALGKSPEKPVSFHVSGDVSVYGMRYAESGGVKKYSEYGGNMYPSMEGSVDVACGNWIHSFGLSMMGNWMFDDMRALDSNRWSFVPGVDYSLLGRSLMVSVGLDWNIAEKEDGKLSYYAWLEKDFWNGERSRLGVAVWGYHHDNGSTSAALYAAWHRSVPKGFSAGVYAGVRFEADSVLNIQKWLSSITSQDSSLNYFGDFYNSWGGDYTGYLPADNPNDPSTVPEDGYAPVPTQWNPSVNGSVPWGGFWPAEGPVVDSSSFRKVKMEKNWAKWVGPTLRSRWIYGFDSRWSLEAKMNLFYGFAVDGPDEDFEKIQKFSGTWGLQLNAKVMALTFYLGADQVLQRYFSIPKSYVGMYAENGCLTEWFAGVKFEL